MTRGYGGQDIPQDRRAEDPLMTAAKAHVELSARMAGVEREVVSLKVQVGGIPQIEKDVADIKLGVATVTALFRGLASKAVLIIVGAVGATFGVTKVTDQQKPPPVTQVLRSDFDIEAEKCGKIDDPVERGACKAGVLNRHVR